MMPACIALMKNAQIVQQESKYGYYRKLTEHKKQRHWMVLIRKLIANKQKHIICMDNL